MSTHHSKKREIRIFPSSSAKHRGSHQDMLAGLYEQRCEGVEKGLLPATTKTENTHNPEPLKRRREKERTHLCLSLEKASTQTTRMLPLAEPAVSLSKEYLLQQQQQQRVPIILTSSPNSSSTTQTSPSTQPPIPSSKLFFSESKTRNPAQQRPTRGSPPSPQGATSSAKTNTRIQAKTQSQRQPSSDHTRIYLC